MMKERILWIDFLRSIGLLLVVLGHTSGCPRQLHDAIYTFHMPLFFFLSGYLWDDEILKKYSFKTYAARKFRSLIIPYFKVAAVCWLVWGIITPPILTDFNFNDFIKQQLTYAFGILYSIGSVKFMPNCTPIWFLVSLFFSSILFYLLRKYMVHWLIMVPVLLVLGWVLTIPEHVVWNLGSAVVGSVFMMLGYAMKIHWKRMRASHALLLVAVIVILYAICGEIPLTAMVNNKYTNYLICIVLGACTCTLLTGITRDYAASYLRRWVKPISFVAANSIAIFGYNYSSNFFVGHIAALWNRFWVINFVAVVAALVLFIIIVRRWRIERWFV